MSQAVNGAEIRRRFNNIGKTEEVFEKVKFDVEDPPTELDRLSAFVAGIASNNKDVVETKWRDFYTLYRGTEEKTGGFHDKVDAFVKGLLHPLSSLSKSDKAVIKRRYEEREGIYESLFYAFWHDEEGDVQESSVHVEFMFTDQDAEATAAWYFAGKGLTREEIDSDDASVRVRMFRYYRQISREDGPARLAFIQALTENPDSSHDRIVTLVQDLSIRVSNAKEDSALAEGLRVWVEKGGLESLRPVLTLFLEERIYGWKVLGHADAPPPLAAANEIARAYEELDALAEELGAVDEVVLGETFPGLVQDELDMRDGFVAYLAGAGITKETLYSTEATQLYKDYLQIHKTMPKHFSSHTYFIFGLQANPNIDAKERGAIMQRWLAATTVEKELYPHVIESKQTPYRIDAKYESVNKSLAWRMAARGYTPEDAKEFNSSFQMRLLKEAVRMQESTMSFDFPEVHFILGLVEQSMPEVDIAGTLEELSKRLTDLYLEPDVEDAYNLLQWVKAGGLATLKEPLLAHLEAKP
ncbi:Hypothetical protein POVN_LOCUS353 [uncultured virus]|nr:Hypothetical protein POVN_LOCUS353 [uncultured virus]